MIANLHFKKIYIVDCRDALMQEFDISSDWTTLGL